MTPGDPALWRPLTTAWDAWVLTLVAGFLYPAWGYLRYRKLARLPDPTPTRAKLALYASIVVSQWLLVVAAVATARRHGLALADLGQSWGEVRATLLVTGGLLVVYGVLAAISLTQLQKVTYGEMPAHLRRARKVLPGTRIESMVFVVVALTAGICEEILYRGWLVQFYGAAVGSIGFGVVLAGVNFGVAHAYQGPSGMAVTGALGIGFGMLFVWTRSLVPGQVLHAAVDLVNGIVAGRVLAKRVAEIRTVEEAEGESAAAAAILSPDESAESAQTGGSNAFPASPTVAGSSGGGPPDVDAPRERPHNQD
jgi:membrane protease YdiL (CAAX protease family)